MEAKEKMYQEYLNGRLDLILDFDGEYTLGRKNAEDFSYVCHEFDDGTKIVHDFNYEYLVKNGRLVTNTWFDEIWYAMDGWIIVKRGKKYNWIDKNGNLLRTEWFDLDRADGFIEGFARVRKGDHWDFVDKNGNFLLEDKSFGYVKQFENGFAEVNNGGRFNFINQNGDVISDVWFDRVVGFRDGYSVVQIGGKYNWIDGNGKPVMEKGLEPYNIYSFHDGIALVEFDFKKFNFINESGEFIRDGWFEDVATTYLTDGWVKVKKDKRYNFLNKNGDLMRKKGFLDATTFEDGVAIVCTDKGYNLIDTEGHFICDCWYSEIGGFIGDYAPVCKDGKYNWIDREGNEARTEWLEHRVTIGHNFVIEYLTPGSAKPGAKIYDFAGNELCECVSVIVDDDHECAYVELWKKEWNRLDKTGKWLSENCYSNVSDLGHGIVRVSYGGRQCLVDYNNEFISDEYDSIFDFVDGFAEVEKDKKISLIDKTGQRVTNEWFDFISHFRCGVAKVLRDGWYNFIDTKGNLIGDTWYRRADDFYGGFSVVKGFVKCSIIDKSGRVIKENTRNTYIKSVTLNFIELGKEFICYTEDLGEYTVKKTRNRYRCSSSNDSFVTEHKPIKIYDKWIVLCLDSKLGRVYLYDRGLDHYELIGKVDQVAFDDDFIYDAKNDKTYLVYDNGVYDITDYLKGREVKNITKGLRLYRKEDYFLLNDSEMAKIDEKAREESEKVKKERALARAKAELDRKKLEEEKRAAALEKESAELDAEIAALFERKKALNEKKAKKKDRTKVPDEVLYIAVDGHLEIDPTFLVGERLKQIDLSGGLYDNVKIAGVDFSDTNINLNPQRVYDGDLRGCNFRGVHFDSLANFEGVKLQGATFGPGKNALVEPINSTFEFSIYDGETTYNDKKFVDLFGPCQNKDQQKKMERPQ